MRHEEQPGARQAGSLVTALRRARGTGVLVAVGVAVLAGCSSGGGDSDEPEATAGASQQAATPSQGAAASETALRLVSPVPGPEFAVGGACPQVLVTTGDGGAASYVVSEDTSSVEQWQPEFSGPASVEADSAEPTFTAGVTADGDPFLVATLVTDGTGSGDPQLEVTTLVIATGESLGPIASMPWEAQQETPVLAPCTSERLALQVAAADGFSDPRAVVVDLTTGEQVLDEPLAGGDYASLAVGGDQVLATLASTYAGVDNTGQPPVASVAPGDATGQASGTPQIVIGGNALDYDYFGAYQDWIPGVAGGDKRPVSTSPELDYESFTFGADGGEAFVTTLPTTGEVADFWAPVTTAKLMVATGDSGAVLDLAAIDYETGDEVATDGLASATAGGEVVVYGLYGGQVWVTVDGRPLVYELSGQEVPEAADWVTFPRYVGQGWAVLDDLDDATTGVTFPGDFEPSATTEALTDLE